MNLVSPALWSIYTSRLHIRIFFTRLHLSFVWFRIILATCVCMTKLGHRGKGAGPSLMITTRDFQFRYIKCSRILPVVWALAGNPSTGQAAYIRNRGHPCGYPSPRLRLSFLTLHENWKTTKINISLSFVQIRVEPSF